MKNVSLNATLYSKSAKNLFVDYLETISSINNFYQLHLSRKYFNNIFRNIILVIAELLQQANDLTIKIDSKHFLDLMIQIDKHTTNFYLMVESVYSYDQALSYLSMLYSGLSTLDHQQMKFLSSDDQFLVEKQVSLAGQNLENLKTNLKNFDFNNARITLTILAKELEKANTTIKFSEKTNLLIQKGLKIINTQIQIISKQINTLINAFNKVKFNFFEQDIEVNKEINDLIFLLKSITVAYDNLKLQFNNFNNVNRKLYLDNMNQLLQDILQ